VTGPHDVIAVVETTDAKALGDLLITKIQIDGIARMITDVVIEPGGALTFLQEQRYFLNRNLF